MSIIKLTTDMPEQELRAAQNSNNAFLGSTLPIGAILPFGGTVAPTGTLFADGSAVSRTTYSALFAAIGTAYGTGDGSTTFNLPNTKGNILVGKDETQTEFNALGKTGGEKTHTLTTSELPTSTVIYGSSTSYYTPITTGNSGNAYSAKSHLSPPQSQTAQNNLPPYLTTNYIIVYAGGVSQAQIDASLQGAKDYSDTNLNTHKNDSAAHNTLFAAKANASDLTAHTSNTANPHGTTKAQIGLGNVENVSITNAISTHNTDGATHSDIRTSVNNAIATAGTNADTKIATHNTDLAAHTDKFALKADKAQGAWIAPTLINGATTDATNPIMYRKNQFGLVEFKGKATIATAASWSFVMPTGYKLLDSSAARFPIIKDSATFASVTIMYNQVYAAVGVIDFTNVKYYAEG